MHAKTQTKQSLEALAVLSLVVQSPLVPAQGAVLLLQPVEPKGRVLHRGEVVAGWELAGVRLLDGLPGP